MVYDVTSRVSFHRVQSWIDETNMYCNDKITIILVGNKMDN